MTESAFIGWLEANHPALACQVAYCCTAEEMRASLNAATGLAVLPSDEIEPSCDKWKAALEAKCTAC